MANLNHNVYMKVIKEHLDFIQFIVIDLFCGAGGTTTGFEAATHTEEDIWSYLDSIGIVAPEGKHYLYKTAKVIACVNHDPMAIESHWQNHPEVEHFLEDMRILDPYGRLHRLVEMYRAFYPHAKICVWASLECTNFSNAKGGLSRDEDSRTLAYELYNYVNALNPDYLFIENVVEFMSWGPMSPKVNKTGEGYSYCPLAYNKKKDKWGPHLVPDSKKNGQCWLDWRKTINSFGYHDDWKQVNCADHGAITSRNRLFGCFAKEGLPIVWPVATHAKNPDKAGFGEKLKKWNAVKEALDFKDEGKSIFNRARKDGTPNPLSTNTFQRLHAGGIRHIAGGLDAYNSYISKYFSSKPEYKNSSVNDPSPSVTTFGGGALVRHCFIDQRNQGDNRSRSIDEPSKTLTQTGGNQQIVFIDKAYGGKPEDKNSSIESPGPAITTKPHESMVFITKWNSTRPTGEKYPGASIDSPSPTVTTQNRLGKVHFISKYNSNAGKNTHNSDSIEGPTGALLTKDSHTKVQAEFFLDKQYTGDHNNQDIDNPAGAVMPVDKHRLIKAEKFIYNNNFNNTGSSIEQPAPAILASRRHHYIVNPSWFGNSGSIDDPCHVVVARQDKAPLYLITCVAGRVAVPVYEDDCPWTIKLKEFMALYDICDIKMRMLKVIELKVIQGFPRNYILKGNTTVQKKHIGNAVHHIVPKRWVEHLRDRINSKQNLWKETKKVAEI